jgi:hypothetical protein
LNTEYEGVEHQYAGVGLMHLKGDKSSRWLFDENGQQKQQQT